jgi:hypothetical protein
MPSIRAAAKHHNVAQPSGLQSLGRADGTAIRLAEEHNRLVTSGKLCGLACDIGQWHIDGTRQMTGRCREFFRLAHIDD